MTSIVTCSSYHLFFKKKRLFTKYIKLKKYDEDIFSIRDMTNTVLNKANYL